MKLVCYLLLNNMLWLLCSLTNCSISDYLFHYLYYQREALKKVQPCLTRQGFSTRPNVTWDDVGGLDHLREEFYHHVIRPLKFPEEYKVIHQPYKQEHIIGQ